MKFGKSLTAIALGAVMALSLGALSACGPADEQVIREAMADQLDDFKELDPNLLTQLKMQTLRETGYTNIHVNLDDYFRSVYDGFDYSIDEVTVNGSNATMVITLVRKDLSGLEDASERISEEIIADPGYEAMGQDELEELFEEKFFEYLNGLEPVAEAPLTIDLVKTNNQWDMTEEAKERVQEAMAV